MLTKKEILEKADFDLERAKAIYAWLNEDGDGDASPTENCTCTHDEISVFEDATDGKWVRVKIFDEDFLIFPADYGNDGKEFKFDEAKELIDKLGLSLWTKKQALLVLAYIDEINEKLIEIGFKKLDNLYWSATENGDSHAWCISGTTKALMTFGKNHTMAVRPIAHTPKRIKRIVE